MARRGLHYNPTIVIAAVFLFMIFVLYYMKRKQAPMAPPPAGVPMKKYPTWRILPYDPYYVGPPKSDPHALRTGQIAPLSPSVWSSTYKYDAYDIPG